MESASIHSIRSELKSKSQEEILALCLRMAKFKKENKELLTYLLFESNAEDDFVDKIKAHITLQIEQTRHANSYLRHKSIRKTLRELKKYLRYSGKKETEVELLLEFCQLIKTKIPSFNRDHTLQSLVERQFIMAKKRLASLHEDLQFDFIQQFPDFDFES
jgi:hypothetical protein